MGYLLALGILLSTAMPFVQTQTRNINQQGNAKIIMASAQSNLGETPNNLNGNTNVPNVPSMDNIPSNIASDINNILSGIFPYGF